MYILFSEVIIPDVFVSQSDPTADETKGIPNSATMSWVLAYRVSQDAISHRLNSKQTSISTGNTNMTLGIV